MIEQLLAAIPEMITSFNTVHTKMLDIASEDQKRRLVDAYLYNIEYWVNIHKGLVEQAKAVQAKMPLPVITNIEVPKGY